MTGGSWRQLYRRGLAVVLAVLVAGAATPLAAPTVRASSGDLAANCNVNLRSAPSKSATIVNVLPTGSLVTVSGIVPGNSWSATCGSAVAGSSWYAIAAVNGQSVAALFGVGVVFAGTGLFRPSDAPAFLEGVDVSRWQGAVDYFALAGSGKRFVIAKATKGSGSATRCTSPTGSARAAPAWPCPRITTPVPT